MTHKDCPSASGNVEDLTAEMPVVEEESLEQTARRVEQLEQRVAANERATAECEARWERRWADHIAVCVGMRDNVDDMGTALVAIKASISDEVEVAIAERIAEIRAMPRDAGGDR